MVPNNFCPAYNYIIMPCNILLANIVCFACKNLDISSIFCHKMYLYLILYHLICYDFGTSGHVITIWINERRKLNLPSLTNTELWYETTNIKSTLDYHARVHIDGYHHRQEYWNGTTMNQRNSLYRFFVFIFNATTLQRSIFLLSLEVLFRRGLDCGLCPRWLIWVLQITIWI